MISAAISKVLSALALLAVLLVSTLFIAVATMSVVEVSARIAALKYVEGRSNRLEERLARGDAALTASAVVSTDQDTLKILRRISEELRYLEFSGADNADQTINAIRHRLTGQLLAASEEASVDEIDATIELLTRGRAEADRDFISDRFLEELRRLSARYQAEPVVASFRVEGLLAYLQGFVAGAPRPSSENGDLTSIGNNVTSDLDVLLDYLYTRLREERVVVQSGIRELDWPAPTYVQLNRLLYLPTDFLVAISVVLCGAIGSIAGATRRDRPRYFRSIVSGLLAGFIALLLVKGGKSIIYIDISGTASPSVNPYAVAFAGVLAGLFTERAFAVLSDVVDELGERITTKVKDENSPTPKIQPVGKKGEDKDVFAHKKPLKDVEPKK